LEKLASYSSSSSRTAAHPCQPQTVSVFFVVVPVFDPVPLFTHMYEMYASRFGDL